VGVDEPPAAVVAFVHAASRSTHASATGRQIDPAYTRAMPTTPLLTQRALNRAVLARQLLLGRESLAIPRALERIGGIQDQYAPSGYIGLWTRLYDFGRDDLTRALERRTVVQATLLRATIHLVSWRDFWPFARAIEEPLLDWWFRVTGRATDRRRLRAIDRRSRALLAAGPMRRADIVSALGLGPGEWDGVGMWTPLVRVPPAGTWERRRADLFAAAEDWIGPSDVDAETGRKLLLRRYLAAFGPAGVRDIATFTGIPRPMLEPVLASLPLRRFVDDAGAELLDVRGAPLPDPSTPAPVRFLPTWDATLLVHARRTGIVPEDVRAVIFTSKNPQSVGTVLVDGVVAATWRLEGNRVRVDALTPIPRRWRREVDAEARALTAFCA
jgi:winged helix DNA-binding protein